MRDAKKLVLGLLMAFLVTFNIAPVSAAEKITLVAADDHDFGYVRTLFKHWIDADKDGCNTRSEVLITEAIVKPVVGAGCYLSGGKWRSPYDGKVFTNPTGLDIDHMVPLAEAWRSGAWAWTAAQRMAYANDLEDPRTLLAVTATLNRSKGDKDVAQWLPPKGQCTYISNWIAVKWRFDLSIDPIESEFLRT
ncbi:MAG: HNH endonuclease, partial [Actinomycetales bacterium]